MIKNLDYLLPGYDPHISIIANGTFPQQNFIREYIDASSLIIACDGAINQLSTLNLQADYVIGDGDSINSMNQNLARHPYIHIPDQNSTDLTKVVNFIANNYGNDTALVIIAGSGKREDHTIANFSLLHEYAKRFSKIAFISDYGILEVYHAGNHQIATIPGQQISLFSFSDINQISCQELKWPLDNFSLQFLHSGTLNQATDHQLNLICTKSIILYRAFELKI